MTSDGLPHEELKFLVIESFLPRFARGADVLHIGGDTAKENLVTKLDRLRALGLAVNGHDDLPDVILDDSARDRLFLVDAVTSHGPMTRIRLHRQEMLASCRGTPIFVSAFATREEFAPWAGYIGGETVVWIAAEPDHLIHFGGRKLLGPSAKAR